MKLDFSQYIFEKATNIKFQENPASVSRVVSCRCTNGQTDITKLTVAIGAHKNYEANGHYWRSQEYHICPNSDNRIHCQYLLHYCLLYYYYYHAN
jgi:hypothetical protein